jgi:BMFP domain-containing protein YqiC
MQALMLANAFSETAKLARRIQELEAADSELEQYRCFQTLSILYGIL